MGILTKKANLSGSELDKRNNNLLGQSWTGIKLLALTIARVDGVMSNKDAWRYEENGKIKKFAQNLHKFSGLDDARAKAILDRDGGAKAVADNIKRFGYLTANTAMSLINAGYIQVVVDNISHFFILDHRVALALIDAGGMQFFQDNIERFSGLTEEVAENIQEKFGSESTLKPSETSESEENAFVKLLKNVKNNTANILTSFSHTVLLTPVKKNTETPAPQTTKPTNITSYTSGLDFVMQHLFRFRDLSLSMAEKISEQKPQNVAMNLYSFALGELDAGLAQKLINNENFLVILDIINRFNKEDYSQIVENILDKNSDQYVLNKIIMQLNTLGLSNSVLDRVQIIIEDQIIIFDGPRTQKEYQSFLGKLNTYRNERAAQEKKEGIAVNF